MGQIKNLKALNKNLKQVVEEAARIFKSINYCEVNLPPHIKKRIEEFIYSKAIGVGVGTGVYVKDVYESVKHLSKYSLTPGEAYTNNNTMEDKHFEPVTAGSLAKAIVEHVLIKTERVSDNIIEQGVERLLEPHIRKPSDVDKPMFNLEADIEWLVRGCMRIMHNKQDGDGKAYRELIEFVSQKVSPTGPETKSVPARCEEAYNEALSLLHEAADIPHPDADGVRTYFGRKVFKFLQKPNPFKEADIVKEDVDIYMDILEKERSQPKKYPFDLGLAAQGHKVVTRDGRDVKIVAEGLSGDTPVLVVVENEDGTKHAYTVSCEGYLSHHSKTDNPADLFILKEPEPVEIGLYRYKHNGLVIAHRINTHWDARCMGQPEEAELIKTITTTI